MNDEPPAAADDPIDLLVRSVPRQLWVTIGAVAIMLLSAWLFFEPSADSLDRAAERAATGQTRPGRVVAVLAEERMAIAGQEQPVQRVLVEITGGERAGQRVEVLHGQAGMLIESTRVRGGERVLLESSAGPDGERFYIGDFVRTPALLGLIALFAGAAVAVGGWVGLRALTSMGISVLALAGFVIPGILAGHDPLAVCSAGALLLMIASLYLVYGWAGKTHAALAGLTLSLGATALLAILFAGLAHLTGLGSEEASFLLPLSQMEINVRGLLLGGVVLGAVGVLDDVAVGQASAAFELKRANPQLRWDQLFRHSMVIGRDHIASMTNTLLLAYIGASLPLLVLMASLDVPLTQTLNREFVAEEIVRTLVGSLGLILAVPLTSLFASLLAARS